VLSAKVDTYLEAKESAWAYSTWKSEKSRLRALGALIDSEPKTLHQTLKDRGMKPYSIKTLFIRLADLEAWAKAGTKYQEYMETHKNRFKHAYQKEELELTYDQAMERIQQLDEPYRTMALGILKTGVRVSEAYKVKGGKVEGKGGKVRKVFGTIEVTVPYSTFWAKLKAIGLKPHSLRKLCATRLADKDSTAADLCKVFGWSSITTAYQYLQAKEDSRLESLMETGQERS
jgi:integrase